MTTTLVRHTPEAPPASSPSPFLPPPPGVAAPLGVSSPPVGETFEAALQRGRGARELSTVVTIDAAPSVQVRPAEHAPRPDRVSVFDPQHGRDRAELVEAAPRGVEFFQAPGFVREERASVLATSWRPRAELVAPSPTPTARVAEWLDVLGPARLDALEARERRTLLEPETLARPSQARVGRAVSVLTTGIDPNPVVRTASPPARQGTAIHHQGGPTPVLYAHERERP